MLLYAHFLSNGTSITYSKHRVDIPGCYRRDIFSEMGHD